MAAAGPDNCIIAWHIDSQQAWSELVVSSSFCELRDDFAGGVPTHSMAGVFRRAGIDPRMQARATTVHTEFGADESTGLGQCILWHRAAVV